MDSSHKLTKKHFIAHNKLSTKHLAIASIFVAMNIVLTRLGSIMLFGGTVRFSFGNIPLILSGMLLGPAAGMMTGLTSDLLGFLINSHGQVFHPGFTLSSVATGLIPGLVVMFSYKNRFSLLNIVASNVLIFLFVSILMNTYWLSQIFGEAYLALLLTRVVSSLIITAINIFLTAMLIKSLKQTNLF